MNRLIAWLTIAAATVALNAQPRITSPKEYLGFNVGDDYQLANYTQLAQYWRKLDAESDRLTVQEIGKTAEGRPQLMAIVTSPANHRLLAKYRDISRRLALAEGLSEDEAHRLAREGKAVVWIDGGLHATETLGAQQLIESVYQMVSRTDEETTRFLNDCIVLFVHANPDGNELVSNWYMRNPVPDKRTLNGLPRLYQKYIGHDNNRDFFASTQAETQNINRVLYRDWLPQILYNHHQSGPAGTVAWSSPQRDPVQLQPRSPPDPRAAGARHSHAPAARRRGQTGRDDGVGRRVRRMVERWHQEHGELSQHHRHPDRDDRQPDAVADSAGAAAPDPEPRSSISDRPTGVAFPPIDRLLGLVQPGGDRLCVTQPRAAPL